MNFPAWLILSLLISLTIALCYQLASRRFGWRILAYWLLILIGFIGGEVLAEAAGWNVTRLGDLRLLPDLLGSLLIATALWFIGL